MINLRGKEDMRHSPSVNHRLIQWSLILGIRRNTTRNNLFEMSIWSFYDYTKLNMTRGMYYLIKSFALSGRWIAMVINTQGAALGWQCNGLSGRCISYPQGAALVWQCNCLSGRCISYPQGAALGWQCNGLSDRCISYPQGVAVGYGNGNEQPPRRGNELSAQWQRLGYK